MDRVDRRIPMDRMIYTADGPSDVPVFSVVKIHAYGPADYRKKSTTSKWLRMHVCSICDGIVAECEESLSENVSRAPRHLHDED